MRPPEALQGGRTIKFRSVFDRHEPSELNQVGAADLLDRMERLFRRWCHCYDVGREAGLLDNRLDQASVGQAGANRSRRGGGGFVSHPLQRFHEHLVRNHRFIQGYM